MRGNGPECSCHYPFWDIDCSRAQCPNNCWGPDHGLCNNTDGTCTCVGNATVTYTGFDCYVPDPLHVLDPLRFYVQQLLRISPFFINGSDANLSQAQEDLLDLVAKYGDEQQAQLQPKETEKTTKAPGSAPAPSAAPASSSQSSGQAQQLQGGATSDAADAGYIASSMMARRVPSAALLSRQPSPAWTLVSALVIGCMSL